VNWNYVFWVLAFIFFAIFMYLAAEFLIWLKRVIMRRLELRHHNRIMKDKQ